MTVHPILEFNARHPDEVGVRQSQEHGAADKHAQPKTNLRVCAGEGVRREGVCSFPGERGILGAQRMDDACFI